MSGSSGMGIERARHPERSEGSCRRLEVRGRGSPGAPARRRRCSRHRPPTYVPAIASFPAPNTTAASSRSAGTSASAGAPRSIATKSAHCPGRDPAGGHAQRVGAAGRRGGEQGGRDITARVGQRAPQLAAQPLTVLQPAHLLQHREPVVAVGADGEPAARGMRLRRAAGSRRPGCPRSAGRGRPCRRRRGSAPCPRRRCGCSARR